MADSIKDKLFLIAVIILIGLIGFGLGRLSSKYQTAELNINSTIANTADLSKIVTTENKPVANLKAAENQNTASVSDQNLDGGVATANISANIVGNKNSKIYHREDCPGALKMIESNKVLFGSISAAKQAGYRPAGNCPGLQ
ncbi:MAG: Ada metal-binding domain-containing protein [Patescibacteria group bacterium]